MTGFGDAQLEDGESAVTAEIRAVNNRYLKLQTRLPDGFGSLEAVIEKTIRTKISRGTVTVSVRLNRQKQEPRYQLNKPLIRSCWEQLQAVATEMAVPRPVEFWSVLSLPDAVQQDTADQADKGQVAELVQRAVAEALTRLETFREVEGQSMRTELIQQCDLLASRLDQIELRAPLVVATYSTRLLERVREAIATTDVSVSSSDLIREISIFADRVDINEEITRLRSHLSQFRTFLDEQTSEGRKLEFLGQEVFREINTIGSKGNDVEIAHHVVEMKAAVEKIREVLQNVE